jgi:kinesin family protein 6/9
MFRAFCWLQEDVYNVVVKDVVISSMDGYNGTVFAYGQTGSGKTHTITGGERYADRGIIPRALSTIFETVDARPELSYRCFISYMEIYNENIYDLLDRCGIAFDVTDKRQSCVTACCGAGKTKTGL